MGTKTSWKPIASAPKDRAILLRTATIPPSVGSWDEEEYSKHPRPMWTTERSRTLGRMWMRANQPTEWAEIPK